MIVNKINKELQDLLQNTRPANRTYKQYLAWLLEEYMKKLRFNQPDLEKYFSEAEPFEEIMRFIEESCDKLLTIYDLYMHRKIGEAVEEMGASFMISDSIFVKELKAKEPMFRARTIDSHQGSYNAKEMFHVPFEQRGKISNSRYSIAGFPSLYVGRSILACWEEMHKPNIDNLCVSKVSISEFESRYVIDLCWIDDMDGELSSDEKKRSRQLQEIITWIKRLPLVIACSVKAYAPSAPFKEEYVIPQIILLACIDNPKIDGVAYTSTRRDEQIASDNELHTNYAFPAKEVADEGYCMELATAFILTRGISFQEADIKNVFHARGVQVTEDEDGICFNDDKEKSEYECTKFGQMEEYLGHQQYYCIEKDMGVWVEYPGRKI